MNILEQLEKIDEIIERKFNQEAQNMMQILEGSSSSVLGFSGQRMQPLQQYKLPFGEIRDVDNDDVPDNIDYYNGQGQYANNDLNHNGTPDYLDD